MSDKIEEFKSLDELIGAYYSLVKENPAGLPPYATFEEYLERPQKIQELINCLADEKQSKEEKLEVIIQLWATGGDIYVEGQNELLNFDKIIHSVSNTTRLQVCIKGNTKSEKGQIINKENLLKFSNAIGKYIQSFKEDNGLKDNPIQHNLIENKDFKNILNNNIDAAINEILFWYYYENDTYPIINSRAKNSRLILNQVFPDTKVSNDLKFNEICVGILENAIKKDEENTSKNNEKITKQLMLDQLFYSIDEMKSIKEVEKKYKDNKDNDINKFYKKLWSTIKDAKVASNADFFEDLLTKTKNIILYGAPGTGKTWTSETNILSIIKSNPNPDIDNIRFKKVQFHPSYSYEDFMEGLKPIVVDSSVTLKLVEGDFVKFCKEAAKYEEDFKEATHKEKMQYAFFFLVDEINRAELSRVFGEIMYALDKRGNKISTQYSYMKEEDGGFFIPENVYFIGTMNDVDRSIDSFDIALRRRFFWYRMDCDYSVVFYQLESKYKNIGEIGSKDIPDNGYLKACYNLNHYITSKDKECLGLGKLYELGHDYFLKIESHTKQNKEEKVKIINKNLKDLFEFSIEPLLKEYMRAEYSEDEIEQHIAKAKKIFSLKESEENDNQNS